jgi:hypothetical protein
VAEAAALVGLAAPVGLAAGVWLGSTAGDWVEVAVGVEAFSWLRGLAVAVDCASTSLEPDEALQARLKIKSKTRLIQVGEYCFFISNLLEKALWVGAQFLLNPL